MFMFYIHCSFPEHLSWHGWLWGSCFTYIVPFRSTWVDTVDCGIHVLHTLFLSGAPELTRLIVGFMFYIHCSFPEHMSWHGWLWGSCFTYIVPFRSTWVDTVDCGVHVAQSLFSFLLSVLYMNVCTFVIFLLAILLSVLLLFTASAYSFGVGIFILFVCSNFPDKIQI